jgi:hypothetical protein
LLRTLLARKQQILRRYLRTLSPISDLEVRADSLCGVDLARRTHIASNQARPIRARLLRDGRAHELPSAQAHVQPTGELCIELPAARFSSTGASDASRYVVVEIDNGDAKHVLRAHLCDLRPTARPRLVGIERE